MEPELSGRAAGPLDDPFRALEDPDNMPALHLLQRPQMRALGPLLRRTSLSPAIEVGQVLAPDQLAPSENGGALEHVMELPHVAGPVVAHQEITRFAGDPLDGFTEDPRLALEERARERGDVGAPRAERRDFN